MMIECGDQQVLMVRGALARPHIDVRPLRRTRTPMPSNSALCCFFEPDLLAVKAA